MKKTNDHSINQRTVFDTPIVTALFRQLAKLGLGLAGWRIGGQRPTERKYVMIAVPHTTNWDFPITIATLLCLRVKAYWFGKQEMFRFPFGGLMRWLGGIPVDRSRNRNMVSAMAEIFDQSDELVVIIPPEGSRSQVNCWKTGFYRIAEQAGVPVACGFLDYGRNTGGIGQLIKPSGDVAADLEKFREFYADIKGKYPDQMSRIAFKEDE